MTLKARALASSCQELSMPVPMARKFVPKSRRLLPGRSDRKRERTALGLALSCSRELFVVE
jgi:hypothetical protein